METFTGKLPKHIGIERGYSTTCKKAQQFIDRIKDDDDFVVFDDPRYRATFFYDKRCSNMIKLSINVPRGSITYRGIMPREYTHREYYRKKAGNPLGYHSVGYKVYSSPIMFNKITKLPVFPLEKNMERIITSNTKHLIAKDHDYGRT